MSPKELSFVVVAVSLLVMFVVWIAIMSNKEHDQKVEICDKYGEVTIQTGRHSDSDYAFCVKKGGGVVTARLKGEQ